MPISTSEIDIYADYPTIEPSLKLDFANSRALDPRITFLRQSIATYVGEDGLIKIASENEPRFDHDPATGESLGLLLEESRNNKILYSEAIDNAGWTKTGSLSPISANTAIAPDGNQTADVPSDVSTKWGIYDASNSSWLSGYPEVYPFTVTSEWTRQSISFNTPVGCTSIRFYVLRTQNETSYVYDTVTVGAERSYTASAYYKLHTDGTTVLVWGAQLEDGTFPTSYIPTSGSTVTRAVDTAQINGIQFHNPSEFVLYAAGRSNTGASDISNTTTECLVSLGDTTNDYRFMLRKYRYNSGSGINTGFTFRYRNLADGINMDMFPNYFDGQADGYDTTTIAPIWNDSNIHRSALAFEAGVSTDNIRGCADGTLVVPAVTTPGSYSTVSNPGPYTQATTLQIGSGVSSGPFNGTISEVRYYPKRLANSQLQSLTGVPTEAPPPPPPPIQGQAEYTTAGSYTWTAPTGVTSVCVVCVGGGAGSGGALAYRNNITVVPGTGYSVVVGAGGVASGAGGSGATDGGDSSFSDGTNTTIAGGGKGQAAAGGAPSGTYDGGGSGGDNEPWNTFGGMYNGAGAGGYSGDGGNALLGNSNVSQAGSGGGGSSGSWAYESGGGVGIYGEGTSGAATTNSPGQGGSGGQDGQGQGIQNANSVTGGAYGGGFSSRWSGNVAGGGAVRIIWGSGRAFPSTNTADV